MFFFFVQSPRFGRPARRPSSGSRRQERKTAERREPTAAAATAERLIQGILPAQLWPTAATAAAAETREVSPQAAATV